MANENEVAGAPGRNSQIELVKTAPLGRTETIVSAPRDATTQSAPISAFQLYVWPALLVALVLAGIFQWIRFKKFREDYTRLNTELSRYLEQTGLGSDRSSSPGHTYVLASRGPTHSLDAELQSAQARWRHLTIAFPQLSHLWNSPETIVLVSRPYTKVPAVEVMRNQIGAKIKGRMLEKGNVVEPRWIDALGKDFDALRHPELAIACPAFYVFPFLLTWQRRHQWGVLPYATHTRLGVVVRKDHPQFTALMTSQDKYAKALISEENTNSASWISNPTYADWLSLLVLDSAIDMAAPTGVPEYSPLDEWSTRATLVSVDAYLHKELLPLTCAVLANSEVAANFAIKVNQVNQSALNKSGVLAGKEAGKGWHPGSAIIIDLAIATNRGLATDITGDSLSTDLFLIRLPHCVYVPIGIGYSVLAWPLLAADPVSRDWAIGLLRDAGRTLLPAKRELSDIGIEVDERFWKNSATN